MSFIQRRFVLSGLCLSLLIVLSGHSLKAAPKQGLSIAVEYSQAAFPLVHQHRAATIIVDENDFEVVHIAARALCRDINDITGIKPDLKTFVNPLSKFPVFVGTVGRSQWIDELNKKNDFLVNKLKGKWETFIITIIDNPFDGVEKALVIAGSDRRGTAFGVFELSRALGVSPWIWWADVHPEPRESLYVQADEVLMGPPSVKYRGIFLNDEDWGLQPWAARNMDTDIKDIGPKTYAQIFELLLRLKVNFIWPAMHPCTKAFYYYPENPVVADKYAIVVGSSHCEPMLRNNVFEWKENFTNEYRTKPGPWRYDTNREQIHRYWLDRVKQSASRESVYTIGMRGIHDSGIPGPETTEGKLDLLQQVIHDQRLMLEANIGKPIESIPQIFCPYKEVLNIYRAGLKLPDDVTIIWADDNHGYVRQLSTPAEQKRNGASGIYYHLSYWGAPHDYLWLSSTSPSLISFEMSKAYAYGASLLWVFNAGDIKPAEMEIEFAMDLAWDVSAWPPDNAHAYVKSWAARTFGEQFAEPIAQIKEEYYQLAQNAKPEHVLYVDFSPEQAEQRIKDYRDIAQKAEKLYGKIPDRLRDAYFQLILYPVWGACWMNEKVLYSWKSLCQKSLGASLAYEEKAETAYKRIQATTRVYNEEIAHGKWNGMMSSHPRDLEIFKDPKAIIAAIKKQGKDTTQSELQSPCIKFSVTDFTDKHDLPEARIQVIKGLGIDGASATVLPFSSPSIPDEKVSEAPYIEFKAELPAGVRTIKVKCLPTHRIHDGRGLRYAVSVNNGAAQVVDVYAPSKSSTWRKNVLRGYSEGQTTCTIERDDKVILHLYLLDPGLAVSCIEVY
jgi:hypothetical protein